MVNIKNVRIYQDCDELPLHNFEQIRKTGELKWLVYGYDGWGEIDVPKGLLEHWGDIQNEYSNLTINNHTLQYFDTVANESDLETRVTQVTVLLKQLAERPKMDAETKRLYIKELGHWRFYYKADGNHVKEINRLTRQLELVKSKLRILRDERSSYEKKHGNSDLMKTIVQVQNVLKRNIDKRKISVKEWIYTLNNLPKNNG